MREVIVEEDVSADDVVEGADVVEESSDEEGDESPIPEEDVVESNYRANMEVDREPEMVETHAGVEASTVVNPQARQTSSEHESLGVVRRDRPVARESTMYVDDDTETLSEYVRPLIRRHREEDQAESRSTRQRVDNAEGRVVVFATNIDTTRVFSKRWILILRLFLLLLLLLPQFCLLLLPRFLVSLR